MFDSMLGQIIMKGCPAIVGATSEVVGVESGGNTIMVTVCLKKNLFFASKEDVVIDYISRLNGTSILIFPYLGWSKVYLLLGIHHTLVWNRVLKYFQG